MVRNAFLKVVKIEKKRQQRRRSINDRQIISSLMENKLGGIEKHIPGSLVIKSNSTKVNVPSRYSPCVLSPIISISLFCDPLCHKFLGTQFHTNRPALH